jgi:hypothetical protein
MPALRSSLVGQTVAIQQALAAARGVMHERCKMIYLRGPVHLLVLTSRPPSCGRLRGHSPGAWPGNPESEYEPRQGAPAWTLHAVFDNAGSGLPDSVQVSDLPHPAQWNPVRSGDLFAGRICGTLRRSRADGPAEIAAASNHAPGPGAVTGRSTTPACDNRCRQRVGGMRNSTASSSRVAPAA